MAGLFYLLLFYFLGNLVSYFIGGFLPGSIIGMLLLFASLSLKIVRADDLKKVVDFLLDNMILFFVPVTAGIVTSYTLVGQHFWAILVSCTVSTLLVIAIVGYLMQSMDKRRRRK